jgi:hypothetical protein
MGSVGLRREADSSPQTRLLVFVNCPVADKRGRAALNQLFYKNAPLNRSFFMAAVELVVV